MEQGEEKGSEELARVVAGEAAPAVLERSHGCANSDYQPSGPSSDTAAVHSVARGPLGADTVSAAPLPSCGRPVGVVSRRAPSSPGVSLVEGHVEGLGIALRRAPELMGDSRGSFGEPHLVGRDPDGGPALTPPG